MTEETIDPSEEQTGQLEQQEQPETVEEVEAQPKHSTADYNWEQTRQLIQMQKSRIEELESRHAAPKQAEPDEFADLDPDDYVTVSKMQKMTEKKAKEYAMQAVQEYAKRQGLESDDKRMRERESDYDYVIENFSVQMLKDPALAYYVQNSPTPAETAYLLGKTSTNYKAHMTKKDGVQKVAKIQKNLDRPATGAVLGTAKVASDRLDGKSKADIWKESQQYARQ